MLHPTSQTCISVTSLVSVSSLKVVFGKYCIPILFLHRGIECAMSSASWSQSTQWSSWQNSWRLCQTDLNHPSITNPNFTTTHPSLSPSKYWSSRTGNALFCYLPFSTCLAPRFLKMILDIGRFPHLYLNRGLIRIRNNILPTLRHRIASQYPLFSTSVINVKFLIFITAALK